MTARSLCSALLLAIAAAACATDPSDGGAVTIDIDQSLTGQATAAGSFELRGALVDAGDTNEELTFLGPLSQSPVPVTFRRTLAGAKGSIVLTGSASLAFSSPTAATLTGTWTMESGTGHYAGMSGTGTLNGSANFGAVPPTAVISLTGLLTR